MVTANLDLIINGGQVVTPDGVKAISIGVKDGRIVALAPHDDLNAAQRVIDARGKHVLPGLVDPENHMGTQRPLKDSMTSETRAAAAGGVTTWGLMQASPKLRKNYIDEPTPADVVPFSQVLPEFIELVESYSVIDMFLTGFITTDEQALDIPRVAREFGVTSFKYYLHMMQGPRTYSTWSGRQKGGWLGFDDGTIYLGMEKAAEIGPPGVICIHPENYEIVRILTREEAKYEMKNWDEVSLPLIMRLLAELGDTVDYVIIGNNAGQGLPLARKLPPSKVATNAAIIYGESLPEIKEYEKTGYRTFFRRRATASRLEELAHQAGCSPALCFINTIQHNQWNYHDPF